MRNNNIWRNGIMGVVVGDALGCPVQFMSRDELKKRGPVTGMEGYGTFNLPPGTWTDDSSLTLAALASIRSKDRIDLDDIMRRFVRWLERGAYTPFDKSFDIGNTCAEAILNYEKGKDVYTCGCTDERSNGNGSLMRIMPACLYAWSKNLSDKDAIKAVHEVSGLTHNHVRSRIGCGLYYFCIASILDGEGNLKGCLQKGLEKGFSFYETEGYDPKELSKYDRLRDLDSFSALPESAIRSSGYVVDSLEAAIWSAAGTGSFRECLLKAVNLADDADTVGAIAGGIAGTFYGYDNIPEDWLHVIKRREWIEEL